MATKKRQTKPKQQSSATKVTHISARDSDEPVTDVIVSDKPEKIERDPTEAQREKRHFFSRNKSETKAEKRELASEKRSHNPFKATGRYFAGAWFELRHVIWPTRRATWGMTGALIGFTVFFVIVILLCDWGFQSLFNLLLGS